MVDRKRSLESFYDLVRAVNGNNEEVCLKIYLENGTILKMKLDEVEEPESNVIPIKVSPAS